MNLLSTATAPLPSTSIFSTLSPEQLACVEHAKSSRQSLTISAGAGSGKSYCLEAIMVAINHTYRGASIGLLSFNTSVKEELEQKVKARGILNCTVGTAHSFGKRICEAHLKKRFAPNKYKLSDILKIISPRLRWPEAKTIISFADICKNSGVGVTLPLSEQSLSNLLAHHDIDVPEKKISTSEFLSTTLKLLRASLEDTKKIDLSDLIWMPLVHNWTLPAQYDFVIVDEAQDINSTRRELIKRLLKGWSTKGQSVADAYGAEGRVIDQDVSGTVIAVGDPAQAIYGFTGADVDALSLLSSTFSSKELALTYSRRCSRAVINHAKRIVPSINHLPDAAEGSVTTSTYPAFTQRLRIENHDTSAVLCRKNAPLFSLALELSKSDIPCRIEGTEVLTRIKNLINSLEPKSLPDLLLLLNQHEAAQSAKLSAYKFSELQDTLNSIRIFAYFSSDLTQLNSKISALFAPPDPLKPRLTLSSIHKSKGLEWPTVFLLGRNLWMPSPYASMPWMLQQENNLIYVAITRAKTHLVEVTVTE
jgi:superfamily I DNA/RNA helicase